MIHYNSSYKLENKLFKQKEGIWKRKALIHALLRDRSVITDKQIHMAVYLGLETITHV